MKDILIVLLVVALALLVLGAANATSHLDVHYLVGTWHHVSVLALVAIAVVVIVVVGLLAAAFERVRAVGERRKLEKELDHTYSRLREAQAALASAAGSVAPAAPAATDAGDATEEAGTADAGDDGDAH